MRNKTLKTFVPSRLRLKLSYSRKINILACILLSFVSLPGAAQDFTYRAQLQELKEPGWHKIILTPLIRCNANDDLGDLRLYDSKNNEVPYILLMQNMTHPQKDSLVFAPVNKEIFETENDTAAKKTLLKFKFDKTQLVNRIVFDINSPAYYFREANIYINRNIDVKGGKKTVKYFVASFYLNSKKPLQFDISEIRSNNFTIEIENNDNVPLHFTEVQLKQRCSFLIAYLRTEEHYNLKFGASGLKSPKYDLSHFVDLNQKMPFININVIEMMGQQKTEQPKKRFFWEAPWFLWGSIATAAIILFFFSRSLMNDMNKKGT